MTSARIFRRQGQIQGFEVRGHTGYAPSGADIVCAAISAITQTAALGLTEVLGLPAGIRRDDEAGLLSVELPDGAPESAQLILRTMMAGLENIHTQYPDCVRITFSERRN